jgi:hypothetical protein
MYIKANSKNKQECPQKLKGKWQSPFSKQVFQNNISK